MENATDCTPPASDARAESRIALPGDAGTDVSPTGLGMIRAFTASRQNPYVLQAYGGDLKGNVWRFDLSDPDDGQWKVELIAKLTDPNGKAQPITTGVRVEIDQNNNVDRYLFIGTGKLLHKCDLNTAASVDCPARPATKSPMQAEAGRAHPA